MPFCGECRVQDWAFVLYNMNLRTFTKEACSVLEGVPSTMTYRTVHLMMDRIEKNIVVCTIYIDILVYLESCIIQFTIQRKV